MGHHLDPEPEVQSKKKKIRLTHTKEIQADNFTGKIMALVFCDYKGVTRIIVKCFQRAQTIAGHHYTNQLKKLKEIITEKMKR